MTEIRNRAIPVHVDVTIGLEFFGKLRSQQGMVLLREIAESVLHSLHELFLVQNNRSLGSVRNIGIQGLATDQTLQLPIQLGKGIERNTSSKETEINRHSKRTKYDFLENSRRRGVSLLRLLP